MNHFVIVYSWVLIALSTALQCVALATDFNRLTYPGVFGCYEMLLMAALLVNSVLILRLSWQHQAIRCIAMLCLLSLCLCVAGDWINRNFSQDYYHYDNIIKHSYLADSVWFFFPGYALYLCAVFLAIKNRIGLTRIVGLSSLAALLGLLAFLPLQIPGTASYIVVLTAAYACLISLMAAAALLLPMAYSWRAMHIVVIGAALALLADAIIGNFWLFRDGYYPQVAYINWIVYFISQAFLQRLPLHMLACTR